MAFTANTVFEIRTTGNDLNGGGFATGASGTDWSQQDNPQYSVTDGVTNGTTTITSATANFGTDVVGNVIYVAGGTGGVAANRYSIVSRTNSTTIVVDRTTGLTAGTGVTLRIGGAIQSIGTMGLILNQAQNPSFCWVRGGTYTLTSSAANVSGGRFEGDANFRNFAFLGYGTTRGDAVRPIISTGSITGITIFGLSNYVSSGQSIANIELDGVARANNNVGTGFSSASAAYQCSNGIHNCIAKNFNIGFNGSGNNGAGLTAFKCEALNCTTGFTLSTEHCIADSCNVGVVPYGSVHINTIAENCTSHGFSSQDRFRLFNCVSFNNGGSGFTAVSGYRIGTLENCLAAYNTGAGYSLSQDLFSVLNCASCFNGAVNVFPSALNQAWRRSPIITPTVDPFIDRASGDLRLNATPNGGALLLSAGITIPSQLTGSYIGAVQGVYGSSGGGVFNPLNHPLIN